MRNYASATIATIRGVPLKVHVSLIFLLIYVAFVATAQLPFVLRETGLTPGQLSIGPLAWGVLFALGLFVSVAVHEFGHVFVAQSQGVKVRGITLMMLGGVSEMEKMPEKPYAEFKLAIVGPLVSLGLAGILYLIRRQTGSHDLYFFSYWLGNANFALAIFNLLPAFPLDGGRALRSFLAATQGPVRATQASVRVSKTLAWVLGIFGFLQFNILLIFIAFFIHATAQSELFYLVSKGLLKGLRAGELALRTPVLRETDTIQEAASRMLTTRNPVLPVETRAGPAGLISLDDLRRVERPRWSKVPVREVMQEAPKVLDVNDSISQALPEIAMTTEHALPVMENGQLIGIVTHSDLNEILQLKSIEHEEIPESETPPRRAA